MKKGVNPTWLDYLKTLKGSVYESEQFQLTDFDVFFKANGFAHSFFTYSVPFVYLLDYRSGLYINMSENFGGYSSECFLKDGLNHTLEIYQKDHLKLFNREIFPDRLDALKSISPNEHKNYVFSYNVRIRSKTGEYENFLQRNCFFSDDAGNPLFSMGLLMNINHFFNNGPVIQTIEKTNIQGTAAVETFFKKAYYLNEEDKLFSKREKEVLLWMAEGLSSKMIADRMFVSEHTVINHRRNMHDKSNTPNAIALVSFAIKNGII
jgi:DNA-binding CsgD family transcriptional regulator